MSILRALAWTALLGQLALANPPYTLTCGLEVMKKPSAALLLNTLEARRTEILREAQRLAEATLGLRNASMNQRLRAEFVRDSDDSLVYAFALASHVQKKIDLHFQDGKFRTQRMRDEIRGLEKSDGVVLVLHPAPSLTVATLKHLISPELAGMARMALADEETSVEPLLQQQLTSVWYCRHNVCPLSVAARSETFDVHLFGGYLSGSNLGDLAKAMQQSLGDHVRVRYFLYLDSCYLTAPYGEIASLKTTETLVGLDRSAITRRLTLPSTSTEVHFID